MRSSTSTLTIAAMAIASALSPDAAAQEHRMDLGLRLQVTAADGEPANDMPGAGVLAHYVVNGEGILAAAVDRIRFDFEEPANIVGIAQDPAIEPVDALAEATTLSLWAERSISDRTRLANFFVGAGLGAAFMDVPAVTGPRADGGRFDIHTDADTEILAAALVGMRRRFGEHWYGEIALRVEQHFADWRVTDRISGAQGAIDDYFTWGVHVAAGRRW
jgi:hypothetical protein